MSGDYTISFCRNFHAGVYVLAWSRKREDNVGLKAPKKEKRVKRENKTQPPVEAPYVAPKLKMANKSVPDRTVEIFDGMTLLELSKRTGAYISMLQDVLADLGEKVESEFDSISIDLAELIAMVCINFVSLQPGTILHLTFHSLYSVIYCTSPTTH
jgi:translation initiation factor IF-2